jgi:hypothetical protein
VFTFESYSSGGQDLTSISGEVTAQVLFEDDDGNVYEVNPVATGSSLSPYVFVSERKEDDCGLS